MRYEGLQGVNCFSWDVFLLSALLISSNGKCMWLFFNYHLYHTSSNSFLFVRISFVVFHIGHVTWWLWDNYGPPGAFWQHGNALLVFIPLGAYLFGCILSCIKKQTSITYLEDCRFDVTVLLKALRRLYSSQRGEEFIYFLKVFITFICTCDVCIYVYACLCAYEGQSTSWQS